MTSVPDKRDENADASATGLLTIDLAQLVANYKTLARMAPTAECAAVVKANAYGHGAQEVCRALAFSGCTTFFVAGPREGVVVRNACPNAVIYILDGFLPGLSQYYRRHDLRPVLSTLHETREWADAAPQAAAALHIDTGMNRLGLSPKEVTALTTDATLSSAMSPTLVMSHLACGDTPEHPLNVRQKNAFDIARNLFPGVPASLAASAGTITNPGYHYDMVRPGIALYGGRAVNDAPKPTRPVATLLARVLQIRTDWHEPTVGYGAHQTLDAVQRIATLAVGYADGVTRHLSSADNAPGGTVFCAGHHVPIIGRVSMDLITIDITTLPENAVKRGDWVEVIGPNVDVDDVAGRAGTIGYELLTQFGARYLRTYLPPDTDGVV